jgi:hypothetical protein
MKIWQYIDLDAGEVDNLKEAYLKLLPAPPHFFNTVDIGIKEFMGMEIFRAVIINAPPMSIGMVHKDHRPVDNNVLAINIPLINCQDAKTYFWDTTEDVNKISYTSSGSPYIGFSKASCTKIDEFILTKPIIFRTDIPHSVDNHSIDHRVAVSLRFKTDPWHLVNR